MNITDEQRKAAFEASAVLADAVELGPEELSQLLHPYAECRATETEAKKAKEKLGDLLRRYLERHEGEVLWDGEARLEAGMEEYSLPGGVKYDVLSIWENNPELFARLVKHGCVKLDEAAIKAAGPNVGGVARYAFPKGKGSRIYVKAIS